VRGRERAAGFTLVELLVSLVLFALAATLAAQLLLEAQQSLVDSAAAVCDPAVPLVDALLRADVQGAATFAVVPGTDGGTELWLAGGPPGTLLYRRVGDELRRVLVPAGGHPPVESAVLHGATGWSCATIAPGLLRLEFSYRRAAHRRGPLPLLPGNRGPAAEDRREALPLAPRCAGLGDSW
jgi:prepilin-type N-terminal cleavage/methylation domain-containing protein